MKLYENDSCGTNVPSTKLSDAELLAIFPEAKQITKSLIKELRGKQQRLEKEIGDELTEIYAASDDEIYHYYWTLWLMLTLGAELEEVNKKLSRLYRLRNIIDGKPAPKGALPDGAIEAARDFPIQDMVDMQFKRSGQNFVCLCPLHEERTPSCYVYTKQNFAVCYGCNFKGDSIKLYMQLHGVDFKNAVMALSGGRP